MEMLEEIQNAKTRFENGSTPVRVSELIDKLKAWREEHAVSDVVDGKNCQYVDLVLQGGGVLGIGLVGYTYALEQAGIRFLGLGGASAGAINALFIAAAGPPADEKTKEIIEILAKMPIAEFVDGPHYARALSFAIARGAPMADLIALSIPNAFHLHAKFALNHGDRFLNWMQDELKHHGISTMGQLTSKMKEPPDGLRARIVDRDGEFSNREAGLLGRLKFVSADAATSTKFVFPDMAPFVDFWNGGAVDEDAIDPARFVRASMAIPGFFEPYRVPSRPPASPTGDPNCPTVRDLWETKNYMLDEEAGDEPGSSGLPSMHYFIDGGMVSNFPINLFHRTELVPLVPTFGVRLGLGGRRNHINTGLQFAGACSRVSRTALDHEFLTNNPDYRQLIGRVDTRGFHWLDFGMDKPRQIELFVRGVEGAYEFLTGESPTDSNRATSAGFNWENYKETRRSLISAMEASMKGMSQAKQAALKAQTNPG